MKLHYLFVSFLLLGCASTTHITDTVETEAKQQIELAPQQKDLGNKIKIYSIPIDIEQPKDALLSIDFKVVSTGHCATTYEPTVFYLNDQEIVEFDFRDYFLETSIKQEVKLSRDQFNVGLNTLRIETGACDFDIDVLDLNGLQLIF